MSDWRAMLAALLMCAAAATTAGAQAGGTQPPGIIAGTVVSSVNGEPLPRTQITLGGSPLGIVTDDAGRFTITGVPPGTTAVRARALGYRMVTRQVVVQPGERAEVIISMDPLPPTLNPVQTIGRTAA